ncbi:MAG: hypothetical protein WBO22_12220 [Shewanella indica]|uniref:hypothetical protein n=1 Tax=Shewanella indica TaxID=768528 RepID=UPI003C726761
MSEILTLYHPESEIDFSIHPLAREAYEWVYEYPRLISLWKLPSSIVQQQVLSQPLQGVMVYQQSGTAKRMRPTSFQLYAPLDSPMHWSQQHPPEGSRLIHNSATSVICDNDIVQRAWMSALHLFFSSVNPAEMASLREIFQSHLPRHIAQSIFGKKKITDIDLCHWTGCNRSTLVQQRQRAKGSSDSTKRVIKDPIELLNADWSVMDED